VKTKEKKNTTQEIIQSLGELINFYKEKFIKEKNR